MINLNLTNRNGILLKESSTNQRLYHNLNKNKEQCFKNVEQCFDDNVLQPRHSNQVCSMYNNFVDKNQTECINISEKGMLDFRNQPKSLD